MGDPSSSPTLGAEAAEVMVDDFSSQAGPQTQPLLADVAKEREAHLSLVFDSDEDILEVALTGTRGGRKRKVLQEPLQDEPPLEATALTNAPPHLPITPAVQDDTAAGLRVQVEGQSVLDKESRSPMLPSSSCLQSMGSILSLWMPLLEAVKPPRMNPLSRIRITCSLPSTYSMPGVASTSPLW